MSHPEYIFEWTVLREMQNRTGSDGATPSDPATESILPVKSPRDTIFFGVYKRVMLYFSTRHQSRGDDH
jgi:hypothetical protein